MDEFCDGIPFWNSSLTWTAADWPEFTQCFQWTALQWVPCGWLWLFSPVYIFVLLQREPKPQPLRKLYWSKQICSVLLIILSTLDLISIVDEYKEFNAGALASVIWIVTLILHAVVVHVERSRDVVRSSITFVFWLFGSIATLIPFYSAFMSDPPLYDKSLVDFAILCGRYLISVIGFVLNCFPQYYWQKEKDHNPEISASVLSWYSFYWLKDILIKGFRNPLNDDDVYDLLDRDKSAGVYARFEKIWQKAWERARSSNKSGIKSKHQLSTEVTEKTPLLSASFSSSIKSVNKSPAKTYSHDNFTNKRFASDESKTFKKTVEKKPSFFMAMFRTFIKELCIAESPFLVFVAMNIFYPFILGWLMDFVKKEGEQRWHGYVLAVTMILARLFTAAFNKTAQYNGNQCAVRVRSTTIAAVNRKALSISSEARKESTVGEIVNLMSVDATHLEMMVNYSFWMWMGILFIIFGNYLLYTTIGLAFLSGFGFIMFMLAMNLVVMNKMRHYQHDIMLVKDERVKIMSEILNGIKVIKLYGWEPMFIKKVLDIREKELRILLKYAILDAVEAFAWTCSMFWMMYLMLVTYVSTDDDHYLTANKSFITMNFIQIIMVSVNIVPILTKDWIKAATSVKRLQRFLTSEDLKSDNFKRDRSDNLAVRIENATFSWEKEGLVTLRNINVQVQPGKLVAVVGAVGAGKSSLISAVLGEMHKLSGKFNINSSVAYVPQQAWIQNNTVKGNITFGKSLDKTFYRRVVETCALQPDFDIMVAGDQTEIGEKGINLSGGQKQRVSLARAVYSQADIYLMDDPLSAVDSHVGRHIFNQVISRQGLLKNKTRVLVTHGVQWLPEVDHIIVMNNGEISEAGTYEQLISHNGAFAQFLAQYLSQADNQEDEEDKEAGYASEKDREIRANMLQRLRSITSDSEVSETQDPAGFKRIFSQELSVDKRSRASEKRTSFSISELDKSELISRGDFELSAGDHKINSRLTTDEEAVGGKVSWTIYWDLVKGFGPRFAVVTLFLMIVYQCISNFSNVWLADWTDDTDLSNFTSYPANSSERQDLNDYYMWRYTALGFAQTLSVVLYSVFLQLCHISASRNLHMQLLDSVMHAPMSFFDTTPMGRILNRFSQDIEILDNDIFLEIEIVSNHFFKSVATIIIISYNIPIFLSVVAPVIILYYLFQQFYIRTSCQLRRLASNYRSPVYAHFSETLSGVSVIRAYQAQDRFIRDSENKVDRFQSFISAANAVNKWIQTWLEILSCVIIGGSIVFSVVLKDELSSGVLGLILTYALNVAISLSITTEVLGNLETHVVSVERIREYSVIDSEASWSDEKDEEKTGKDWPQEGRIEFLNYSTRYREGLDLVLKGLTCTINGGEKVGLVGRTGAGKSSMVLSVFRLVEAAGGRVLIDGVDIASLGLHALRRHLTILPQDPVLFAGSLRMNLDPFGDQTEDALWTALEHAHLKSFVESLPQRLDHEVGEGGENLSVGQRQLVCLARTLLRKTKILVLDEATAAVDMETDDLIQKTIRTEFSGCTILTIAHRLNTVMDYDRIMVLQSGELIEFDSPNKLLSDSNSAFYSMAKDAGLVAGSS